MADSTPELRTYTRRRPTASIRRGALNREEEQDHHEEEDHEEHQGPENEDNNEDGDEILRGSFPGGPIDPSVLCSFNTHVAAAIWKGDERGVLKCWSLASRLLKWKWPTDAKANTWKELIKKSGLMRLRTMSYRAPNRNLISTFVERWQPETNSFHLPFVD